MEFGLLYSQLSARLIKEYFCPDIYQKQGLLHQRNHDKILYFCCIVNNHLQLLCHLLYGHQTEIFLLLMR